jgi:transcriptional regulator GlxA family with amidase domain
VDIVIRSIDRNLAEALVTAMNSKTVGLILLDHAPAVAATAPAEAFARARIRIDDQPAGPGSVRGCYRVLILGVAAGPCTTECGISIQPHLNIEEAPQLDTLFVCGGTGIHGLKQNRKLGKWLKYRSPLVRRVVAVGTGVYELAAAGLMDQRQVAIHWRLADDFARRFPSVRGNPNVLFTKDGSFYSCAGGASAVDLSLSLIEEDFGRHVALNLARDLLLPFKRSGEQEQYSEALRFQVQSSDRFADLPTWILSHLSDDLSIEALAQRAAMSRRNFTRLFHETFGKTPAQFVAEARIAEAQKRLLVPRNSIESIASSLGFRSADVFSLAFERLTGIRPRIYRALRRAPKSNSSASLDAEKSGPRSGSAVLRAA